MEAFQQHRPRLLGIAYRMIGTRSDAEDIVQDAYLRWHTADQSTINNAEAFLVTTTTRLCLDFLKSAKHQRESYVGTWLPEPLVTDNSPADTHELADTLSYAFLLLLEQLNPSERAAYILREAFDLNHDDIASVLDTSAANSRQITKRAKQHIQNNQPRFETDQTQQQQIFEEFITACGTGNMAQLSQLLADDVTAYSDGGGKVTAALRPLHGKERVLRLLNRLIQNASGEMQVKFCQVNNKLGLEIKEGGVTSNIVTVHIANGKIEQLFNMRNPDKLQRIEQHTPIV